MSAVSKEGYKSTTQYTERGRRALADAYNLVVGLCPECHAELHDRNPQLDKRVQAKAQEAFEQYYPEKSFLKIFGKNYK